MKRVVMKNRISDYLSLHRFSPEDLAVTLNVSVRQVYRWISGRAEPRPSLRYRIAEILHVDPLFLYYVAVCEDEKPTIED